MIWIRELSTAVLLYYISGLIQFVHSTSWDVSLRIIQAPENAVGGEEFSLPPIVAVYDRSGGRQYFDIQGSVSVKLLSSVELGTFQRNSCLKRNSWGLSDSISFAKKTDYTLSIPLYKGVAIFPGLCVNEEGLNYRLVYTFIDEYGIILSSSVGSSFPVIAGRPFQLGIISQPGDAYGGLTWGHQPILSIQDRGGNTVASVNEGTVFVEVVQLRNSSSSEALRCDVKCAGFNVTIREGVASFYGLYLNNAVVSCQLRFTTDVLLPGGCFALSAPFSVKVGSVKQLQIVDEPGDGQVVGGESFIVQPRLHVVDAGGNILNYDSCSVVTISIASNPSFGVLYPREKLTAVIDSGVAQFSNLAIDKAGRDYRLIYNFMKCNDGSLENTDIYLLGGKFNVNIGSGHNLKILQSPKKTWADNQPFGVQLKVALTDAGDNVLTSDTTTVVTAYLVPSLAQVANLIIDTSQAAVPWIENVLFDEIACIDSRFMFSVGDAIIYELTFSQEVVVKTNTSSESNRRPSFELRITTSNEVNYSGRAVLSEGCVERKSRKLIFQYNIDLEAGSYELVYPAQTLLDKGDFVLVDLWERAANLTLPGDVLGVESTGVKHISVSGSPASLLNVSLSVPSGEYAAGQEIFFRVDFSRKVKVIGVPMLPIKVKSCVVLIETVALGTSRSKSYFFVRFIDRHSKSIPWNAPAAYVKVILQNLFGVALCVSRSTSARSSGTYSWAIRFDGLIDTSSKRFFEIKSAVTVRGHRNMVLNISFLDTDSPLPVWVAEDGDGSMCTARYASYKEGSESSSLYFSYLVLSGDSVSRLDVMSPGTIAYPSELDAIYYFVNIKDQYFILQPPSLENISVPGNSKVLIDTSVPYVIDVSLANSSNLNKTYAAGESCLIEVYFNKPVIVSKGLSLSLNVGRENNTAGYVSGSGTNKLVLKYTVQARHFSSQLDFLGRMALFITGNGYVRRFSNNPITDASLVLPRDSLSQSNSAVSIDGRPPAVSNIYVQSNLLSNTFVARDTVSIVIEFTASVVVYDAKLVLLLMIGDKERSALLASGNRTKFLIFNYTVMLGDCSVPSHFRCLGLKSSHGLSEDGKVPIYQASDHPVLRADASLPKHLCERIGGGPAISNTVKTATVVVSVQFLNSDHELSIGDRVRARIIFSDAVICGIWRPQLYLNTGSYMDYEAGCDSSEFFFNFIAGSVDVTDRLEWSVHPVHNVSLVCGDFRRVPCVLKNIMGDDVVASFQYDISMKRISIDSARPVIVSVHAIGAALTSTTCPLTAGDEIRFIITFSHPVEVEGNNLRLKLDSLLQDDNFHYTNSLYAYYEQGASTGTVLVFVYKIEEGYTSLENNVSYICTPDDCSIILDSADGIMSRIRRKATFPSIDANSQLPHPSQIIYTDGVCTRVEAISIPRVTNVRGAKPSEGVYSAGDRIELIIEWSHSVHVFGSPFLLLQVGNISIGTATYAYGTGSKELTFVYFVGENHFTIDLDYVDVYSLEVSNGTLYRLSLSPVIVADLRLPVPGSSSSLSGNSDLYIDGRIPFITSIWSPSSPGRFGVDDIIVINIEFSRPVVVEGTPSLRLALGHDQEAVYTVQPAENSLQFQYKVQLGDFTPLRLDYWTNETIMRSSSQSIRLNGGSIKLKSVNPIVDANIHLNPGLGFLSGQTARALQNGVVEFDDLTVGLRGSDYKVRLHADYDNRTIFSCVDLELKPSCEFELIGAESDRGDNEFFGYSVSIHNSLLAVGVPHKRHPSPEIQVLTVSSLSVDEKNEVQVIVTQLDTCEPSKLVHTFVSSAHYGETIGGTMMLYYSNWNNYNISSPLNIPVDVEAMRLSTLIEERFPFLGEVSASRSANTACKCHNAWTWSVTFLEASISASFFHIEGANLTGAGSFIAPGLTFHSTSTINGTFSLINSFNGLRSRHIAFDASSHDMEVILVEDLQLEVIRVVVTDQYGKARPHLGRRWIVTFSHFSGPYGLDNNVPNLIVDGAKLEGVGASVSTYVASEGRSHLGGSFAVSMIGSAFSYYIPCNATADQLRDALESLESINLVSVSQRQDLIHGSRLGYVWTITFLSVNQHTKYGWVVDPGGDSFGGNLPSLEVSDRLLGVNVSVDVSGFGYDDVQAHRVAHKIGSDGLQSGSVAIYRKEADSYLIEMLLTAPDHNDFYNFGTSVCLYDNILAIGASSKEVDGSHEQQTLTCIGSPSSGTFTVSFRGFTTEKIMHNATITAIRNSIVGPSRTARNIHPLPNIAVQSVGNWTRGFCDTGGNTIMITFFTPDGSGVRTDALASTNIESLSVDVSELIGGSILVSELRAGSNAPIGNVNHDHATGREAGSLYIYERVHECALCYYNWTIVGKITPIDGMDEPSVSSQFGLTVSITSDSWNSTIVVVGSPGFQQDKGKVYIFIRQTNYFVFHSSLTPDRWEISKAGCRFGQVIATYKDTIMVSAPGYHEKRGAVYVFQQTLQFNRFLPKQAIYGLDNLEPGDQFGYAVSLHGNNCVICAPNQITKTYELSAKGVCYVYNRRNRFDSYDLVQLLSPSNVGSHDRFGHSASISGSKIIIGQLEEFVGKLVSQSPVQILTTFCRCCSCNNSLQESSFWLTWRDGEKRTRQLNYNVSASLLKKSLEEDLETGVLSVTRSSYADSYGGHTWSITFNTYSTFDVIIPRLSCDAGQTSGSMYLACSVSLINEIPLRVRSKVHVFTLDDSIWTEQAFLFPRRFQKQDLFGFSVALDGDIAVVGAPNRESRNINSGSAIVYDLGFADVSLQVSKKEIIEGEIVNLYVTRKASDRSLIVGLRSIDRNAEPQLQDYINALYGFRYSERFPLDSTAVMQHEKNSAFGRDQSCGNMENKGVWLDGKFDYRAVCDYKIVDTIELMGVGKFSISVPLETANDGIFENPDETLSINIFLPGMFASTLGKLHTSVKILDDGDGTSLSGTHYTKLLKSRIPRVTGGQTIGSTIDINNNIGMMIVGDSTESGYAAVSVFQRDVKKWIRVAQLTPYGATKLTSFGKSLCIDKNVDKNSRKVSVLIGAPESSTAFIFTRQDGAASWQEEDSLALDSIEYLSDGHGFADSGAISLNGDTAFIGAAGLETVFIYRRHYGQSKTSWKLWTAVTSSKRSCRSEKLYTCKERFGAALASMKRHLLVGAPFSAFSDSSDIAKGVVYAFYSPPHVQRLSLNCSSPPSTGSFRLYAGNQYASLSTALVYSIEDFDIEFLIEQSMGLGEVSVAKLLNSDRDGKEAYVVSWMITFLDNFDEHFPLLTPLWKSNGCSDCEAFSSTGDNFSFSISVELVKVMSDFEETTTLSPKDITLGERFGHSIALDRSQAIVGALFSSAHSRTTWNFETGDLSGWSATGTAFKFQPTFGDNSRLRSVYNGFGDANSATTGQAQSGLSRGRYYIGTFEKRPGDVSIDYSVASAQFDKGNIQGDSHTGTLTSDPFIIMGHFISFLLGGGCDYSSVYVELLIDGFPSLRATGLCEEEMRIVKWDVWEYLNRAAQIRVVDNHSSTWGHINVDEFTFDWDLEMRHCNPNNQGQCVEGGGAIPSNHLGSKTHYLGPEETSNAGAAYIFHRDQEFGWIEQTRLVASDKRPGAMFGSSVSIDEREGIAVVGSPYAFNHDINKAILSIYQNRELSFVGVTWNDDLEHLMKSKGSSHSRRTYHIINNETDVNKQYHDRVGAIYIYLKHGSQWMSTEHCKLIPSDILPGDMFGYNIGVHSSLLAANARDGAYIYNILSAWLRFTDIEYTAIEGVHMVAIVSILRDKLFRDQDITVGYSTSDLSAVGVDRDKFTQCLALPLAARDGCGDYEQTWGEITFPAHEDTVSFQVKIMDDPCSERQVEYVQLQLHVPGGNAIHGEGFRAVLKIYDDDGHSRMGSLYCPGDIS